MASPIIISLFRQLYPPIGYSWTLENIERLVMNLAPIAIFAFNRPAYLSRLLESLEQNRQMISTSKIFIFIDGAKNPSDNALVERVTSIAKKFGEEYEVEIFKNKSNLGLSHSIISGINEVFKQHSRVIVLEDDLIVNPSFLEFCNSALDYYEDNDKVGSIQGFSEDIVLKSGDLTYFQRGADCWGWATWKSRWDLVDWNSDNLIRKIETANLAKLLDYNGSFPYSKMLIRQNRGEVDSWAIRWHVSLFAKGLLSLYPTKTLVENTGRDGSGTHTGSCDFKPRSLEIHSPSLGGIAVEDSKDARRQLEKIYRSRNGTYSYFSFNKYYKYLIRKTRRIL
jgi:hypothetical protein